MFAFDWRGTMPSKEKNHGEVKDLLTHLGKMGDAPGQIFYSLNHKNYHSTGEEEFLPAEPLALVGMGFDIIGGVFRPKAGGGGSSLDSLKIFDPNELGYQDVLTDAPVDEYPVNSSIDLTQIAQSSDSKNRELRKLLNSEGLSIALKKLRAAIQNGHEKTFLEDKRGYCDSVEGAMTGMADAYEDATGPNVEDYSSS